VSGAAALLDQLPPWVLVVGKGGVGKTTCAAALAIAAADGGTSALVLSTDPARALSDALGAPLGPDPLPLDNAAHLSAFQLDAFVERDRFLERWREVLVTIIDRGTYLERGDVASLVDGALPGVDETMALLRLAELAADDRWQRIIIDTAPTGHTLRLLDLPRSFTLLLSLLDAILDKPLTEVLKQLAVAPLIRQALADKTSQPGKILDTVRHQNRGDLTNVSGSGFSANQVFVAWFDAIRWTQEIMAKIE